MTNEREPLWSDERIEALAGNFTDELDGGAGTYHLFCVAMGNVRDDYEARIAELEQKLSRAAQYKGAEAYPCPLCRYEDGIFVESCAMHNRIAELETQLAQTWQPVSANFILTHDTGLIGRPKQFVRWNVDDESVIVGEDDGNFHHCPLPTNIRLCRKEQTNE